MIMNGPNVATGFARHSSIAAGVAPADILAFGAASSLELRRAIVNHGGGASSAVRCHREVRGIRAGAQHGAGGSLAAVAVTGARVFAVGQAVVVGVCMSVRSLLVQSQNCAGAVSRPGALAARTQAANRT